MNQRQNDLFQSFREGSMLRRLVLLNVAAFVVYFFLKLLVSGIDDYLYLPYSFNRLLFRPWTIVSYMFLHEGVWHLVMNMLWLYWFGTLFMRYFNPKQLVALYLLGGIAGAALHLFVGSFFGQSAYVVGASGAVMSVVFAVAAYKPNYSISLLLIGAVRLKYMAAVIFLLDLMSLAGSVGAEASSGVAHLAHMGGAFFGLWFGYAMRSGKDITRNFNRFLDSFFAIFDKGSVSRSASVNFRVSRDDRPGRAKSDAEYNQEEASRETEINRILEKISRSGYNSLTNKEKEFLFKQKKD